MTPADFVVKAVAVAMAALGDCDGTTVSRKHEPHGPPELYEQMAWEATKMARDASAWCGYVVPPEIAWTTMLAEGGAHNLNRDHVRDPMHRSTGFFAMRPSCYSKFSRRAELPCPTREMFPDRDEWSLEVCAFNRDHPLYQVRVYFAAAAFYLRQEGGRVDRFFSIWRWGYPTARDYPAACERIWRGRFGTYPKDGQLARR